MGFHLEGFSASVRKQLSQSPKFYFFDTGVQRALADMLTVPPHPGMSYFGELFKHVVLQGIVARNSFEKLDDRFSYLLTKSGAEIDLVVTRPGRAPALVEIKSADEIRPEHLQSLTHFSADFPEADLYVLSRDPRERRFGRVQAFHWTQGLESI